MLMNEEKSKLEVIEDLLNRFEDIKNSYAALVKKIGNLLFEMQESGLTTLAFKLENTFTEASNNTEIINDIYKDLEMERNRLIGKG
jgi:hypothetical protein